jgi:hypothetical protein
MRLSMHQAQINISFFLRLLEIEICFLKSSKIRSFRFENIEVNLKLF